MQISIRAAMRQRRGDDTHPLRWAFEEGSQLGFDGVELCMQAGWRLGADCPTWTPQYREARPLSDNVDYGTISTRV